MRGIANLKDQTTTLDKFRHKLSEYDLEILYKPGKTNLNVDATTGPVRDINGANQIYG